MASILESKSSSKQAAGPSKRTVEPIVTGATVLGLKYKDGVLLMADTLASYGSMARFRNMRRIQRVNECTAIAASGEMSDFQHIQQMMEDLMIEDVTEDDGAMNSPAELHSFLGRVMYQRRSKADPLWNQMIVGGHKDGKSFVGYVDLYGSTFVDDYAATGYGVYYALPIIRKSWRADMTFDEAKLLLEDAMRVLVYRDARAFNRFQLVQITAAGVNEFPPYSLATNWSHKAFKVIGE